MKHRLDKMSLAEAAGRAALFGKIIQPIANHSSA